MNADEMRAHLRDVECEDYKFNVIEINDRLYLQGRYPENDIATDELGWQHTAKWPLSIHMSKSELVQRALKCVLTSHEHRVREHFRYKGRRVYGPHFNVDALWGICTDTNLDYRGEATVNVQEHDALIVVDVQNDFVTGSLAVRGAEEIIPAINNLIATFGRANRTIVMTKDWHPADHRSFQEQGGVWPVHCVQDTRGAEFADGLTIPDAGRYIECFKGDAVEKDAYSAFDRTNLVETLRERNIARVVICGLATDYCVLRTALDAIRLGFDVVLVTDAMAAVNVSPRDGAMAMEEMLAAGCKVRVTQWVRG